MLRQTKNKLKTLLSGVFRNSFVTVKQETVTVRSYTLFKVRKYRILDVLAIVIPERIADRDISDCYRKSVNTAIRNGDIKDAIDNAYDLYFEYIKIVKDVKTPHEKFRLYEYLITKVRRVRFNTWPIKRKPVFLEKKVENLKKKVIETLKDTNELYRSVVSTGNEAFDAQFRQIQRYNPLPMAVG